MLHELIYSPFSKGKEGLCSAACGALWQGFKLDGKGEREHIGPAGDILWGDTQWLEGQGASKGPQPFAQRTAGDTAARSCRDQLGTPEVVSAIKEASGKHPKGNKTCSSVKVT